MAATVPLPGAAIASSTGQDPDPAAQSQGEPVADAERHSVVTPQSFPMRRALLRTPLFVSPTASLARVALRPEPSTATSGGLLCPLGSASPRHFSGSAFTGATIAHRSRGGSSRTFSSTRIAMALAPTNGYESVLVAPRTGTLSLVAGGDALTDATGDLLVIAVWGTAPPPDAANGADKDAEDTTPAYSLPEEVAKYDTEVLGGTLAAAVADAEFSAKAASSTDMVRVAAEAGPKRVVLYGLGDPKGDGALKSIAGAASFAVQKAMAIKSCSSVSLAVGGLATEAQASAIAEGAHVAAYVDERYKEKKVEADKVPKELTIIGAALLPKPLEEAMHRGVSVAAGIVTTKEVVASPANYLHPLSMAAAAKKVAEDEGLEYKVLSRDECAKLGMGSYLGVGQGAAIEPQFIHMVYKPEGEVKKKIAIIGKTVCHDTGGYNLKAGPGSMIELMKWDMGGGGTTIGAARAIGMLKPPNVEVHFIMPAVLNMISQNAFLPGDILTASNGKTIEVLNTDAEGRLCLCDALVYAEKHIGDLDAMVDIATLTGACIVALGNDIAGMWTPSDDLSEALMNAAKGTPDKYWRMPLAEEYAEQLKSKIADLRNIGQGRGASSITAALFLKEFVKTKEWAHLDIAGTAWSDKKGGATGFGVRTMVNWVESLSA